MPAYEYLTNKEFLLKLDKQRLVQQHVKITCLDFDENPQDEITGNYHILNHLFKELELTHCKAIAARAEEYAKDLYQMNNIC